MKKETLCKNATVPEQLVEVEPGTYYNPRHIKFIVRLLRTKYHTRDTSLRYLVSVVPARQFYPQDIC